MSLTEQQKAMRRTGIGASEIAALAGLSRWASPMEIFAAKVAGVEKEATIPMDLGDLLEEPMAQLYARRLRRFVARVDTLRHPTLKLALATPDRAVFTSERRSGLVCRDRELLKEADRLLQLKSTTWRSAGEWGAPGTDEVPEDYHAQVTWEMGVAGVQLADVGVLFDKDRFEIFTVPFSQSLFDALYSIAEKFWRDHVLKSVPPPPDASERYAETLAQVYPRETSGNFVTADEQLQREIAAWGIYKAAAKVLKSAIAVKRARICSAIGAATGVRCELGQLTWKATRPSSKVDWQAVATDAKLVAFLLLNRFRSELPAGDSTKFEAQLNGLVALHTTQKAGHRRLTPKWSLIGEPNLPPVLELPRLEAGDETSDDDQ